MYEYVQICTLPDENIYIYKKTNKNLQTMRKQGICLVTELQEQICKCIQKKETGLKKPLIHVNTIHLILQNFKVLLG